MGSHSSLPDQRLDVTKKKTLPPDVPRRLVHLSPCYNHWFLSQHELDLSSFSITIFQQAPWVAAPVSASPSTPWRQLLLVELIEVRAIFSAFRHLRHLLVYLLKDSLLRRREALAPPTARGRRATGNLSRHTSPSHSLSRKLSVCRKYSIVIFFPRRCFRPLWDGQFAGPLELQSSYRRNRCLRALTINESGA